MTHHLQTGIQDGRNAEKMRKTEIIVRVTEGDKGYEVLVAAEMPDAQLADSIRAAEKICRIHLTNIRGQFAGPIPEPSDPDALPRQHVFQKDFPGRMGAWVVQTTDGHLTREMVFGEVPTKLELENEKARFRELASKQP